jgi:quinoprotein glucose dehydrogenase
MVSATIVFGVLASWVVAQESPIHPSGSGDWPSHNLDLHNTRFSPLTAINAVNASKLKVMWSFDEAGLTEQTPIVVGGVMYLGLGSTVIALNASTGATLWKTEVPPSNPGGRRGPGYGDGRVYSYSSDTIYAVDAKTGKPLDTFGEHGALRIINKALEFKYPGKYASDFKPNTVGWSLASPPRVHANTIYIGTSDSDSLIAGGLLIAANATTGAIKWVFTTVPQGPQDEGWEIAKDTWSSSYRPGGGVWTQPAIDPDLGLLYVDVANPAPDYDGSARHGTNLFTDSTIALHLDSGKLAWYFQTVHHDVWDKDAIAGPVLFDVTTDGKTVHAIGTGGKTCLAYFWNRENGRPLNPVVETPVPTTTDNPGEQLSPTQPIPYTSRGVPSQPFCATYPIVEDPELAKRARPMFHPWLVNEVIITSPGLMGGANFGPPSYSPRTGLFYITGKNDAWSIQLNPVGDRLKPAAGSRGHFDLIKQEGKTGMVATTNVAAYNPVTGQLMWTATVPAATNGGNLVTAGDVVFQGSATGDIYAFDAKTGQQLLKYPTGKNGVRASPMSYAANGKQYIAMVGGNTVLALALP